MSISLQSSIREKKPVIRVLQGETVKAPPVWLMRQAGRYLPEYRKVRAGVKGFLELCYTPELAEEVTLQPIRRFGFDAAILFSDILVVPDALGQAVRFEDGEGPRLEPLKGAGDLSRLRMNEFHRTLAPVYQTVSRLSDSLPPDVALIGFAGAPWTVATYMVEGRGSREFVRARGWGLEDPKGFARLLEIICKATAEYLCRQVEAGAEVLQIFDSWAGILPEYEFRNWVLGPTTTLVELVKKQYPDIPIIGFPRGAGIMYENYVAETGVDAISLDQTVPVGWAASHLQTMAPVQGNLDPLVLLKGGEALERGVRRILEALSDGPLVFNLGHGIIKETPPENVTQLLEIVRGWSGTGD